MEHGSVWLLVAIALVSFLLSFIGAAVGLVLGHLRLPLLITYLHSPVAGAATNLVISGVGALAGTYRHIRAGRISWVGLAIMGIPSAIGAIVAVLIFVHINPFWSYLAIGFMLVISGVNLIIKKEPTPPPGDLSMLRRVTLEVVIGLGLGALAAITGLMLGSLRLPMMIRYLRMDPKVAVGTNMAVGCLTGLIGAVTAFLSGIGRLDWLVLGVVVPPTVIGAYFGGWLTGKLTRQAVQKMAGWIVAVSGVLLLGQGTYKHFRKAKPPTNPPLFVHEPEATYDDWFEYEFYDSEHEEMLERLVPQEMREKLEMLEPQIPEP